MKYINNTLDYYGDMVTLRMFSPVARNNAGKKFFIFEFEEDGDDFGPYDIFHPKDATGVIQLRDDYMFGLRCDHLVCIDGVSHLYGINLHYDNNDSVKANECLEYLAEVKGECAHNSILLIANHKGSLVLRLIIFEQ